MTPALSAYKWAVCLQRLCCRTVFCLTMQSLHADVSERNGP
jgi:hypothetical protein